MQTKADPLMKPLWKNRNYMLLWGGQGISWLGTEISGIAMPLIILTLTGSPALAGAIGAMRGITYVLLAIPAGYVLDRWNRRNIMIVGNLGSGLAMLSVSVGLLLKHLSVPTLFILMGIEGGCFVFANIGRFSARRFLVSTERLHSAAAQDSMVEHLALMIGPSLGGFLYQTVGAVISFLADAMSYFINVVALSLINSSLSVQHTLSETNLIEGLKEGAFWLWRQKLYKLFLLLSYARGIVTAALSLLIIVVAKQLHATALTIGIILAISAGAGIVGSAFFGKIARKYNRYSALSVTGIACTVVFFCYLFASNLTILTLITAFLFALLPSFYIICGGIAGEIPHHIQGRITSITRSGDFLVYSFGLSLVGFTLQYAGDTWTILIFFLLLAIFTGVTIANKGLLSEDYK